MNLQINCNLGDGKSNDAALLPLIDACSIPCGGHAGDIATMRVSIELAMKHEVKIGVLPSYPNHESTETVNVNLPLIEVVRSVKEQLIDFLNILEACDGKINHLKFHGALYNDTAQDEVIAEALMTLVQSMNFNPIIFCPAGSLLEKVARRKFFITQAEGCINRRYNSTGKLVDRNQSNAMISDTEEAYQQFINLSQHQHVKTTSGEMISLKAKTFSIDASQPSALVILEHIRSKA